MLLGSFTAPSADRIAHLQSRCVQAQVGEEQLGARGACRECRAGVLHALCRGSSDTTKRQVLPLRRRRTAAHASTAATRRRIDGFVAAASRRKRHFEATRPQPRSSAVVLLDANFDIKVEGAVFARPLPSGLFCVFLGKLLPEPELKFGIQLVCHLASHSRTRAPRGVPRVQCGRSRVDRELARTAPAAVDIRNQRRRVALDKRDGDSRARPRWQRPAA